MVARIRTVAFQGIDVLAIDAQVQISGGLPGFAIVGLPDKAVGESRERVRAALQAMGLSLPPKRITINLAPADVAKEGSHFDLPIALALLTITGVLAPEEMDEFVALGELGLDGAIRPVAGVLPAAVHAASLGCGLICPAACGGEAVWAADEHGRIEVIAPASILQFVNHMKGTQVLSRPQAQVTTIQDTDARDMADIKGQESAKRAVEIAAAGGHNMLMSGPPGAGKSMLASRLPGLLPPLDAWGALEVSMIHSVAGLLKDGRIVTHRPYRDPHHSASLVSLVGGGQRVRPGEMSLAHRGVLFLDELPEFNRQTLEALRQPLETGQVTVSRAQAHISFPARVQLIGAMNPCRCGYLDDPGAACRKAPRCAQDYQARLSGPLLDRIDLHIDVPAVTAADLALPPSRESTTVIADRVARARARQLDRFCADGRPPGPGRDGPLTNAEADGAVLERIATPDSAGHALLTRAAERLRFSARSWHRVLRVARTIADLDGVVTIGHSQVAEALSYRRIAPGAHAL